jgi:hypothetical protein
MNLRRKLQPIDYAVMFGGPILFFLIFWVGIRAMIGPVPEVSPVKRIRDGEIAIGAKMTDVQKLLGRANEIVELPNGNFRFIFTRTVYEAATQGDSLDEGIVDFSPEGRVLRAWATREEPPKPGTTTG